MRADRNPWRLGAHRKGAEAHRPRGHGPEAARMLVTWPATSPARGSPAPQNEVSNIERIKPILQTMTFSLDYMFNKYL